MKKSYLSLLIALLFFGCTKTVEPEPAEQVIGSYTISKLIESIKYATSPTEQSYSYNLPFKASNGDELSASVDFAKKSANIISGVYIENYKTASTGKTQTTRDALDDIELKTGTTSGQFDMYMAGIKVGTIGNKTLNYEESTTAKDSVGKTFTYKFSIIGAKP